jgi:hypothetical protein
MAGELLKGKEKRKLIRTDRQPGVQVQQHAFLTDPGEVKKMEKDLLDLMKDFNEGKLHAFGRNICFLRFICFVVALCPLH